MADRLAQTVDIETPELVVVSYTIAGVGSRIAAGLIDFFICVAAFIGIIVLAVMLGAPTRAAAAKHANISTAWAAAIVVIMQFAILWGYYVFAEGFFDGRTIGKRLLGLRAVRDGGYSLGFAASAVRNLMRMVDLQPAFTYLIGIAGVAISEVGQAARRRGRGNDRRARGDDPAARRSARRAHERAGRAARARDGTAHRRGVSTARSVGGAAVESRSRSGGRRSRSRWELDSRTRSARCPSGT